jgi:hypothetical protein
MAIFRTGVDSRHAALTTGAGLPRKARATAGAHDCRSGCRVRFPGQNGGSLGCAGRICAGHQACRRSHPGGGTKHEPPSTVLSGRVGLPFATLARGRYVVLLGSYFRGRAAFVIEWCASSTVSLTSVTLASEHGPVNRSDRSVTECVRNSSSTARSDHARRCCRFLVSSFGRRYAGLDGAV